MISSKILKKLLCLILSFSLFTGQFGAIPVYSANVDSSMVEISGMELVSSDTSDSSNSDSSEDNSENPENFDRNTEGDNVNFDSEEQEDILSLESSVDESVEGTTQTVIDVPEAEQTLMYSIQPLAETELIPLTDEGGTLAAGYYILNEDITLKENITILKGASNAVTIDLNGHILEGTGNGSVIKNNGYLTILDSQPEAGGCWFKINEDSPWEMVELEDGTDTTGYKYIKGGIITGGRDKTSASSGSSGGGAVKMGANDRAKSYRLYLNGGTLVGNSSTRAGGAVYGGTIYMNGGTVTGNYATMFGGGLSLSGSYYMNGGLVEFNNTSSDSSYNTRIESKNYDNANVIIGYQSEFVMTDGIIRGNVSTVYNTGSNAPNFTITGGLIEGNFRLLNELEATFSGGELNGYIYMNSGICNVEGDAKIKKGKRADGGSVCIRNGSFNMSGGLIEESVATSTGGAIHIDNGTCTISGGIIRNCIAPDGGGVYLGGGTFTMSGGEISGNTASNNGGGAMITGGNVNLGDATVENGSVTKKGGSIKNNTAQNIGGGFYVDGGTVNLIEAYITDNTAQISGGGIAVNNGNYRMVGGAVDNNKAISNNGGGIYVSADGENVQVDILSGSVSNNTANEDGGAFSVVGAADGTENITVTIGVNEQHFDTEGNPMVCEHDLKDATLAYTCPQIKNNSAASSGGAVHVAGNANTVMNIFCIEEENSSADGDKSQGNFMKVDGGRVLISTTQEENLETETSNYGNVNIESTVYVTGGIVDIWGDMTNPYIKDIITVDVTASGGSFNDYRIIEEDEEDDSIYYKLLYYENFTLSDGLKSGQYKEETVLHGSEIEVRSNVYEHTGYIIFGWNTHQEGDHDYEVGTNPDNPVYGWYRFDGTKYLFDNNPRGDLTLYAKWIPITYAIAYNPNVPHGETVINKDKMSSQQVKYDVEVNLTENVFIYPGHIFVNWLGDDGVAYTDKQAVKNLKSEEGDVLTLYAQWADCSHNEDECTYTYSVLDSDNNGEYETIRRDCSCLGYFETVTLSAQNAVYNQNQNPAKATYSSDKWMPAIKYSRVADNKGNDDITDDEYDSTYSEDSIPVNAGEYLAWIEIGGVEIQKPYSITKATQPKPELVTYVTSDDKQFLTITTSDSLVSNQDSSYYDKDYVCVKEYRLRFSTVDENGITVESTTEWTTNPVLDLSGTDLSVAYTSYYIESRYAETDDYFASEPTSAENKYFFTGAEINVHDGVGVEHYFEENESQEGTVLVVRLKEGYYFPEEYSLTSDTEFVFEITEETDSLIKFHLSQIPVVDVIEIILNDATKIPTITNYVIEKQVFDNVTGVKANISNDSAFTAYFEISDYDNTVYDIPVLKFDKTLPLGSKIILLDKTDNSYYSINADSLSEIDCSAFVRMGEKNKKYSAQTDVLKLQFIVDFSQVNGGFNETALTTELFVGVKKNTDDTKVEKNASDVFGSVLTTINPHNTYALNSVTTGAGLTQQLKYSCTSSLGVVSKLDWRQAALIVKLNDGYILPSDAYIEYSDGTSYIPVYMNENKEFIIPLSNIGTGTISISLISDMLPKEVDVNVGDPYPMIAQLVIAESIAETSPINGTVVAECDFVFTNLGEENPSTKITFTDDKRVYNIGETVYFTVTWTNMGNNINSKTLLGKKSDSGNYIDTGWFKQMTGNSGSIDMSITLSSQSYSSGTFKISTQVIDSLAGISLREAETSVYFIVR